MQLYAQYLVAGEWDEGHRSEWFEIPTGLTGDDAITFIRGVMFEEDWSPGTPHAIYFEQDGLLELAYAGGFDEGERWVATVRSGPSPLSPIKNNNQAREKP